DPWYPRRHLVDARPGDSSERDRRYLAAVAVKAPLGAGHHDLQPVEAPEVAVEAGHRHRVAERYGGKVGVGDQVAPGIRRKRGVAEPSKVVKAGDFRVTGGSAHGVNELKRLGRR